MTDPSVSIGSGSGTSTGLLDRARQQQADAWDKLVTLYGPLVYRWVRRWGLQPKDAENVGQEVFLRVFQRLPEFQHQRRPGGFRAWLRQIAHNCFFDHGRKLRASLPAKGGSEARRRMEQVPDETVDSDEAETASEENRLLFSQAAELIRREFTERDWQIFSQVELGGRRPADVAADLKINTNVVYLAKSRVLRRLREEFADLFDI